MASPPIGATPFTSPARPGEWAGLRSTRVAPNVENAAPVAMPWATRAARSRLTSPAKRNRTNDAASIAMAESGGRQYAHSPTNDYGYWQINGSHGPGMATYNAYGNARAAVLISGYGSNWHPWSTYTSGAYYGRC